MTAPRQARDPQRGNSLLLALIVMSSLATLGSLTVVSVQSSLKASTNDRSQTVAALKVAIPRLIDEGYQFVIP